MSGSQTSEPDLFEAGLCKGVSFDSGWKVFWARLAERICELLEGPCGWKGCAPAPLLEAKSVSLTQTVLQSALRGAFCHQLTLKPQ